MVALILMFNSEVVEMGTLTFIPMKKVSTTMKNILIIDGALNSRYEVYQVTDAMFETLFHRGKQEIYLEDLDESLQGDVGFWNTLYHFQVDKKTVDGIHGILHTHPRFHADDPVFA